jgi:hypothetical protein
MATGTRGQWHWQQGLQVTKRARARAARGMETTMRVVGGNEGKGEGNGEGDKGGG